VVLPSAPLAAAMQLAGSRKLSFEGGRLNVGGKFSFPMDESGYSLVRWDAAESGRAAKGSLKRSMSAWKLLVNLWDHELKRGVAHHDNDLAGRVAVLTDASSYAADPRQTPIGPAPGAALMGQALVNILRSDGISRASPERDLLLTVGMALFGAILAVSFSSVFKARAGPLSYLASLVVVGGAYVLVARHLFLTEQRWIAVAGPLLAMSSTFLAATGYASALEHRFREFITSAFGRYVHPDVARRVESDIALMHPERRQVTVYLADVVGFTALSSKLPPNQVVGLLNEYFTEATLHITRGKGYVDRYLGDSVMAFWGAPVRLEEHARAACECALEVDEAVEKHRAEWEKKFGQRIEVRAALTSGEVVAGDMGSDVKSNYSVLGEPVDLAGRLEAACRRYGTRILASDATYEAARGPFVFREVDRVRFADKGPVVRVHELMGASGHLAIERAKVLALYLEAMTAYQARRFAEAGTIFSRCASEFGDKVAELYVGRCRHYAAKPPAKEWDGVYDGP
ncbi:MAG: adenylate/guanylate cyclase domain-containing protein, partial [Myxococcaceae bacterium]